MIRISLYKRWGLSGGILLDPLRLRLASLSTLLAVRVVQYYGMKFKHDDIACQQISLSIYIYLFMFKINGLRVVMLKTAENSENIFLAGLVLSLYRRDHYFYVLSVSCQNQVII